MFLQEEGVLPLHVQRELQLLRSVRHPAVIGLLQVKQQVHWNGTCVQHTTAWALSWPHCVQHRHLTIRFATCSSALLFSSN
jgi:hypothetical protein